MKKYEFITIDDMSKPVKERKATVWCSCDNWELFRDFSQYVLDNCNNPDAFMIVETESDLVFRFYPTVTKKLGMRKRTFDERMKNVQTGIFAKYQNIEEVLK